MRRLTSRSIGSARATLVKQKLREYKVMAHLGMYTSEMKDRFNRRQTHELDTATLPENPLTSSSCNRKTVARA